MYVLKNYSFICCSENGIKMKVCAAYNANRPQSIIDSTNANTAAGYYMTVIGNEHDSTAAKHTSTTRLLLQDDIETSAETERLQSAMAGPADYSTVSTPGFRKRSTTLESTGEPVYVEVEK